MSKDKPKLWKIIAVSHGEQPHPHEYWSLVNKWSEGPEGIYSDPIYRRDFIILSPKSEDALFWVRSSLAGLKDVRLSNPVQQQLDYIIEEVADLTPLIKD